MWDRVYYNGQLLVDKYFGTSNNHHSHNPHYKQAETPTMKKMWNEWNWEIAYI